MLMTDKHLCAKKSSLVNQTVDLRILEIHLILLNGDEYLGYVLLSLNS